MQIGRTVHIMQDLEELAVLAGFTGTAILGEMHAFRARDPWVDDIGEGMSPLQVTLILFFNSSIFLQIF